MHGCSHHGTGAQPQVWRRAGFTLVEIMITVAIVGLLASIALPSFVNARQTSQKNVCISHLLQISSAKDQYALSHNGAVPTDLADLFPEIVRRVPHCPRGGTYSIGVLGADPTCTLSASGHTL